MGLAKLYEQLQDDLLDRLNKTSEQIAALEQQRLPTSHVELLLVELRGLQSVAQRWSLHINEIIEILREPQADLAAELIRLREENKRLQAENRALKQKVPVRPRVATPRQQKPKSSGSEQGENNTKVKSVRRTGTVIRYDRDRGTGAIKADDNDFEYYVIRSQIREVEEIQVGDRVAFLPGKARFQAGRAVQQALNVIKIAKAA